MEQRALESQFDSFLDTDSSEKWKAGGGGVRTTCKVWLSLLDPSLDLSSPRLAPAHRALPSSVPTPESGLLLADRAGARTAAAHPRPTQPGAASFGQGGCQSPRPRLHDSNGSG